MEIQTKLKKFHKKLGINVIYGDFFKMDLSILKKMDIVYLYRPVYDEELATKLLDLVYKNIKDDAIVVYALPHGYRKDLSYWNVIDIEEHELQHRDTIILSK